MDKIKFLEKIIVKCGFESSDVLVKPDTEIQKMWRDSNFEVYSKNKDFNDFNVFVLDNTELDDIGTTLNNVGIILTFSDLMEDMNFVESLIEDILSENLNYKNILSINGDKIPDTEVRNITLFDEFRRIDIYSKDDDLVGKIADVDKAKDSDFFYLSWINSLKTVIEEKERIISLRERDIEALDEYVDVLENNIEEKEEKIQKESERFNEKIDKLSSEKNRLEEEKKEILEKKENVEDSLRSKNEELRREIEKIKRKNEERINNLKDEMNEEFQKERNELEEELNDEFQKEKNELEEELNDEIQRIKEKKESEIQEIQKVKEEKEGELEDIREKKDKLERELKEIKSSISYKLGSSVGDTKLGKFLKE